MLKKHAIIKIFALTAALTLLISMTCQAAPYTVVKRDSLWKIAREQLGDGKRYIEIFEANKDQITDPAKIQIGQVLEIPEGKPAPVTVPKSESVPESVTAIDLPVKITTISKDEKFGSAVLAISPKEFEEAGFHLGDSCDISFENGLYFEDIPFYDGYYVKVGKPVIVAYPGSGTVKIAYNSASIWDEENLIEGESVTIQMNTPGKYADFQEFMGQKYFFNRKDYASNEEFCNFRELSGGSLKEGFFYRGASPVDNSRGRASYTDSLLAKYNIRAVLNLADSKEDMESYQAMDDYVFPYTGALYKDGKMHLAGMNAAFVSEKFKQKLVLGLRDVMNMPGPLYIHCTEGKDRTGYVCILLEALAGASYEEMQADYMQTYKNYYGVDKESTPERYNAISGLYFDDFMCYIHDTENVSDLIDADFSEDATNYLLEGGMTIKEISDLKKYLTD